MSKIEEENVTITISKIEAEKLWHILKNVQDNDKTKLEEFHEATASDMHITEYSKRQFMALLLSEIHIAQNVMRAIRVKIPFIE